MPPQYSIIPKGLRHSFLLASVIESMPSVCIMPDRSKTQNVNVNTKSYPSLLMETQDYLKKGR